MRARERRGGGRPQRQSSEGTFGQRTVLSLTLVRANAGVALGLNPFVQRHVLAHIGGIDHDMATEIDAARLLIWRAGWMLAEGIPLARGEGSMAKLYAGDMAMRVTTEAVQVLGGYGYIKEYPVERFMRDAKVYQIWEGRSRSSGW